MTIFKFRRGVQASRTGGTPNGGEPLWTTDDKKLYMGDGSTAGGVAINIDGNAATATTVTTNANLTGPVTSSGNATTMKVEIIVPLSDETTALGTGTAVRTFRLPYAMTLTSVRASVATAPTGATVLSTKLSIDVSEKTSTTAATAPVISDSALADDAEITFDIDQVGSTIEGAGLIVTLIGTRTT